MTSIWPENVEQLSGELQHFVAVSGNASSDMRRAACIRLGIAVCDVLSLDLDIPPSLRGDLQWLDDRLASFVRKKGRTLLTAPEIAPVATVARRAFEESLSLTATLAEHFLRRGRTVRLTLAGAGSQTLGPLRGRSGLVRGLVALAEVRSAPGNPQELLREFAASGLHENEVLLGVLTGGRRPVSGQAAETAPFALLLDVDDPSTSALFRRGRRWGMSVPLSTVQPAVSLSPA